MLTLRFAIGCAFVVQFISVFGAARRTLKHRGLSFAIAAAIGWAIYPLTNLYNRGALTEFFAATFFNTAIALAISAAVEASVRRTIALAWFSGVFALLAFGTHPPTALMGGVFGALLLTVVGWQTLRTRLYRPEIVLPALGVGVLGAMALGPWVYANLVLRNDLYILSKLRRFAFVPSRTDSFLIRFAPFPYDAGSFVYGGNISSPYVETQISIALLILAITNAVIFWQSRRARESEIPTTSTAWRNIWITANVWFVFTVSISVSPALASWFAFVAAHIQFPSRFVSQSNVALLITVLTSGVLIARRNGFQRYQRSVRLVALLVLAGSLIDLGIKLKHGWEVKEIVHEPRYAWRGDRSELVTSGRMDAGSDYAAIKYLPQLLPATVKRAQTMSLPVGSSGAQFGVPGDARLEMRESGWVVTNVVAFRWTHLLVDGAEVPLAERAANEPRLVVRLPAGVHTFRWSWEPPGVWRSLRCLASFAYVLLFAAPIALLFVRSRSTP